MSILLFANQAQTTLALPITSTQTTITVASGTGTYFPAPSTNQSITLTIVSALSGLITEIISCTNITGDVLTVARGQEGTVARAWNQGDFVINMMTAGTGNAFAQLYGLDNGYYSPIFNNMSTTTGQVATAPINGTDLANKAYVDSVSQGVFKAECQVATTANITLSGLQVIDGYTTLAGDRVLVKNQFNNAYNGIYVASTTVWVRAGDMSVWSEVPGAATFVQYGTLYANTGWNVIAPENGTINVTPIIWTQFSGYGTYTAGTGLTLTGTQFSITSTGVVSGTYGTATSVPTLSINPQGQITSVSNTPISIAPSQINATIPNSGLTNSSITIGSTNVALGNTLTTLAGVSISGSTNTFTNIPNSGLVNSSITINGNLVALGGSTTVTAQTPNALTIGTGLSGTSFNGSAPVTIAISPTTVTAGSYGSAGSVATFTVNAQGQLTNATTTSIAISNTQVSGLGTMSTQNANSVAITGGTIQGVSLTIDSLDNTPIGSTTASTAKFTTLSANSTVTLGNYTGYIYANGLSAISASTTIPTTALSGTITNAQLANSSITINGTAVSLGGSTNVGTVTSVTATAPISVTNGTTTPAISISQASSTTNGYLSSTDWNTFNSKQPSGTYVTSVSGTTGRITSSGGITPIIDLASGVVTAGTTGSSTLIPVVTVDTYGRVTNITTASNPQGTVTSVSGTGTVNGITLTGTVTSSGSLTLGGTLGGIANSQLTNSTISGISLGSNLASLTIGTGLSGTSYNGSTAITIANTGVLSVTGTSPVSASTTSGATTVSLSSGYGDTQNPYASKTANYVLASPNGTAGVPSFRSLVNADLPSSGVTSGTYGSASVIPVLTVNSQGIVTSVSTQATNAPSYQGVWNASTNTPTLTSSVGTAGYYYVVSVAGNTTLNGVSNWNVGDWAIFENSVWQKIPGSTSESFTNLTTTNLAVTGLTGYMYANNTTGNVTASTTIPTTALSGTITNAQLANSTISGVSLGSNLFNLTAGTGVNFSSGTTYNGSTAITINATGTGGTVTSVSASGGTTGLSFTGSPITTSGTLTLGGTLAVSNGGTGVVSSSGANSVVLRDANGNITTNCIFEGYVTQSATGTTLVLIASSAQNYQITGSGGQTIRLPDATTLPNGATFTFNNNQSSGTIVVQNNSSTTVATIQSGGYTTVVLLNNSTSAGSWDRHDSTPSNVSWSTNTLDYAGSITSATWNGNVIAYNRGGTGISTAPTQGGVVYGASSTTQGYTSAGTAGQVLISNGTSAPTFGAIAGGSF